jgi:hypothetical protein
MAGFLGGSSGSGTGGEIQFPAEFIDPVTKLRVSEPETLIDTDFEYGLRPTKWETVELINNTPSFFSKSGDTTIGNITSMVTTAISREIKVTTSENHGLAVGIPINVSGTKSITADGSYIINSIPDPKSFTYLAKQNQDTTASIFDLYTSIITGEFFQGSQIKISDSQGIVTNAGSPSALTVQTDSPHGFQVGTPFYFLNLNSTVSQQFDASNTGAKTFDSSNSATAQTFDGSNTLTSYVVDFNNKAITSGTTSATQTFSSANKTITVLHTSENFASKPVGTPLYYNVIAASGYFNTYPRGIVYLADNTFNALGSSTSTFSVASVPGGTVLDIPTYPSGTFQLATNAVLFAGNNNDSVGQLTVPVSQSGAQIFDGANSTGSLSTVNTYSGTIIQNNNDAGSTISSGLGLKSMVLYTTTGTAASGLTNNTTYWVTYYNEPAGASVPGFYQIKVAATPGGADISISGGTGTQKFRQIGVSVDKDIFYIPLHGLANGDMVKYSYPAGGAITMASLTSDYAYVGTVYDTHNFSLDLTPGLAATGGDTSAVTFGSYKVHTFLNSGTFTVTSGQGNVEALIVGGGGTGGARHGGGGGAGGMLEVTNIPVSAGAYPIVIGNGGPTFTTNTPAPGASANGSSTTAFGNTAYGGGGGGTYSDAGSTTPNAGTWGSAGGMGYGNDAIVQPSRGVIAVGTGTAYGTATSARVQGGVTGTGGGGAGNNSNAHAGGSGRQNNIDGNNYYYAGGGGGSSWGNSGGTNFDMRGGIGGGGGGGSAAENWDTNLLVGGGSARNAGGNGITGTGGGAGGAGTGGTGGANTGGGGGGSGQNGGFPNYNGYGGGGGKGIVIVRYIG